MIHHGQRNAVVFANLHGKSHQKIQVHCKDHCQLHYIACTPLLARIRLQSKVNTIRKAKILNNPTEPPHSINPKQLQNANCLGVFN